VLKRELRLPFVLLVKIIFTAIAIKSVKIEAVKKEY